MSLFGNLMESLWKDDDAREAEEKPCSNCPSDCGIYPDACEECVEYKKKLLDQLYFVEHIEEYYARYQIAGTESGPVEVNDCPCCGAGGQRGAVCEYCGSALKEDDGKIHVSGASEIPDPIQEAQDLIFDRQEIVKKYSSSEGTGLLNTLFQMVAGTDSFGGRMSTEQIKTIAAGYGVSVASYLAGLDNGTYLTSTAREKQLKEEQKKAQQERIQEEARQREEREREESRRRQEREREEARRRQEWEREEARHRNNSNNRQDSCHRDNVGHHPGQQQVFGNRDPRSQSLQRPGVQMPEPPFGSAHDHRPGGPGAPGGMRGTGGSGTHRPGGR